jgi:CheY-like chemotaxis protein
MTIALRSPGRSPRVKAAPQPKPGVLVVDDQASVRQLLQLVFEQQGCRVWLAANGQEGLQLYEEHQPEITLVLLDVRMPGLDGPQTLTALQAIDRTVVCCFMTGQSGDHTETELLARGATRVFAKPFNLGELRAFHWQSAARRGN